MQCDLNRPTATHTPTPPPLSAAFRRFPPLSAAKDNKKITALAKAVHIFFFFFGGGGAYASRILPMRGGSGGDPPRCQYTRILWGGGLARGGGLSRIFKGLCLEQCTAGPGAMDWAGGGAAGRHSPAFIRGPRGAHSRNLRGAPLRNLRGAPLRSLRGAPLRNLRGAPLRNLRGAPLRNLRGAPLRNLRGAPLRSLRGAPLRNLRGAPRITSGAHL